MQSHFWEASLLGFPVHLNTLIMVGVAVIVGLSIAAFTTQGISVRPSRRQIFGEMVYDFCRSITYSSAGKRGDQYLYYVGSVFIFVLVCNLLGQFPLKIFHLPHGELMAPTGDFNVPAAVAIATLVMYFVVGIKSKGLKYFQHYLTPLPDLMHNQTLPVKLTYAAVFWPFILLNIAEDFTRPGSLMIRLFCNIFVGEILTGVAHSVSHFGLPVVVIFIELFVAVVQAYIFAMLSNIYISLLSEDHSHDEDHAPHPSEALPAAVAA
jgi:F-type H+-transporting ATPase subunit a